MKKIIIAILIIITLIYFVGFFSLNNKRQEGIIVLAYHHFLKEKDKEAYYPDNYYVIATEKFDKQMKYLKDNNYQSISIDQIECYIEKECDIPKKAFIVTIDDGNVSSYYEALPILEKYGFNSVNFIISSRINSTSVKLSDSDLTKFEFIGQDILKDIKNNHPSMVIASHSDSLHGLDKDNNKLYTTKTYDELLNDAKTSREKLYNTVYMAYPFGGNNEDYQLAVKNAGYKLAFTFKDNRKLTTNENRYALPRIDIRANFTINDFQKRIEGKITLKEYTKGIIKKILGR